MREFKIEEFIGKKFVIFEDGCECPIFNDRADGEYFSVPNWVMETSPEYETLLNMHFRYSLKSFTGRIKDALLSIMNGDGDAICYSRNHIWVNYYLDREVGEQYRTMTINGFKGMTFAYVICSNAIGFGISQTKHFETYADAEKYVGELIQKAYEFVKKFDLSILNDQGGYNKLNKAIVDYMGNEYPTVFLLDIMMDMLDSDLKLKYDEPKLDRLRIYIDQCVVAEK